MSLSVLQVFWRNTWRLQFDFLKNLKPFLSSTGINGKMYANLHGLNMAENDKTEWYLIGLGNEVDMHTVHFHAQSFIYRVCT